MTKLLASALLALFVAGPAHALDAVVTSCANEDDLRTRFEAVQTGGGGRITFSCGQPTIVLSAPLMITTPTTIDGGDDVTLSGGGDRRIFQIAAGVTATLESLVLVEGKGPIGGAILNEGDLTLSHVSIMTSEASQDGGAIASYGNLTVADGSILAHNEAASGGAIFAPSGSLTRIEDSEVSNNTANGVLEAMGGAVELLDGADLEITNGTIANNSAKSGGAIFALGAGSTVTIDGSVVRDNHTIDGPGGGVLVSAGALAIVDSTFAANDAINGSGGGVFLTGVTSGSIRRSTFSGNSSTVTGGAIALDSSSGVSVENVTFSQNGAVFGGGFVSADSSATIDHSTFAFNVATLAGASFSNSAVSGTLGIRNTIVASPVTSGNCSDDETETIVSFGGNLSSDDSCVGLFSQESDLHETEPMLGETLEDNGGPTRTYLPQPGSPVVDAGVASEVATDQRGVARPQGSGFDIGAIEIAACSGVVCGDANDNGSVSASDALAALRTAVGSASCSLPRCDYDGSGTVQASDALAILRASVGQPSEPSCPAPWDCRDDLVPG